MLLLLLVCTVVVGDMVGFVVDDVRCVDEELLLLLLSLPLSCHRNEQKEVQDAQTS